MAIAPLIDQSSIVIEELIHSFVTSQLEGMNDIHIAVAPTSKRQNTRTSGQVENVSEWVKTTSNKIERSMQKLAEK